MENNNDIKFLNRKDPNEKGEFIGVLIKRDFRFDESKIFIEAVNLAKTQNKKIVVFVFVNKNLREGKSSVSPHELSPIFPNLRQLDIFTKVLYNFENELKKHGIPLIIVDSLDKILSYNLYCLLTDFKPLNYAMKIDSKISRFPYKVLQIDAHNIVPCWIASTHAEYQARTLRIKLEKLKSKYLVKLVTPEFKQKTSLKSNVSVIKKYYDRVDHSLKPIDIEITTASAKSRLNHFLKYKIKSYDKNRNDANIEFTSKMSVFYNYGVISRQNIVFALSKSNSLNVKKYIDELWVRNSLADNFCYFKRNYNSIDSGWDWSRAITKKNLRKKRKYSLKQLHNSETDDELWNACQTTWRETGLLHGYLRMFWSKRIVSWASNYQEALNIANYLNNAQSIDGYDSNSYTGNAWSIIAVHDKPFYGMKIRPMKPKLKDYTKFLENASKIKSLNLI